MKVIKDHKIETIDWDFSEEFKTEGNLIFPFTIYEENREAVLTRSGKTGISLDGFNSVDQIEADLNKLDIIALDFPAYTDGRCFSHAYLLRNSYQYKGDLLAFGDILRDQIPDLERCGINIVKFTDHRNIEDALNAYAELTTPYQESADNLKTISQSR